MNCSRTHCIGSESRHSTCARTRGDEGCVTSKSTGAGHRASRGSTATIRATSYHSKSRAQIWHIGEVAKGRYTLKRHWETGLANEGWRLLEEKWERGKKKRNDDLKCMMRKRENVKREHEDGYRGCVPMVLAPDLWRFVRHIISIIPIS